MRHESKEWYTCDRCSADIKKIPHNAGYRNIFYEKLFNPTELKLLIAERNGYITDTQLISPEITSVAITEGYAEDRKTIHLCGKCRKEFERFMKNKTEVCK